jgi:hypothetical protein
MSTHIGRDCPKWKSPLEPMQYLGSVAQGLGYFHVEVSEESKKTGFMKFLDNCAVLTIEEGEREQSEIVENLQVMFDKKWHWQLREIEEYKYLVKFPPHKQVSATLISDTTYFKLRKEGVLVSIKAWDGEIEPCDTLDVVWVEIRGVPPKWCSWKCFRQIASSIGKMVEIDWSSLFSSFFSMVRVKIACKDPTRIPRKSLFEMNNNFYLIQFKVEKSTTPGDGDDKDGKGDEEDFDNGDDAGMEELHHDPVTEGKKPTGNSSQGKSDMGQNVGGSLGSSSRPSSNRKVATWASLFQTKDENFGLERSKMGQYSCSRLLREMEAVESEAEDEIASMTVVDVEMMTLHATLCAKLTKNKCDTYLLDDI